MSERRPHDLPAGWWADNLDELDGEIARLAFICKIRILQPGIIGRVLQHDASVCGSPNEIAFDKLRDLLMVHLAIRQKMVDALGSASTAQVEAYVLERLKQRFGTLLGDD